jgi:hypothetical protein
VLKTSGLVDLRAASNALLGPDLDQLIMRRVYIGYPLQEER